jgi:NADH-quinone oxidoreductase subunit G
MGTLYIDGKPFPADPGRNLLQVCLELGFDLPYFCWHPVLGSVGSCRQCAVKQFRDETDTKGRLVMACMTPAADGTRISIEDPEAHSLRTAVIEWLMTNHPHDCPVCEEGGECHLQDMTVMAGHTYRRDRFPKRTFRNQDLGPFLGHEMNRCITCYRCVRFYRDYAGGHDLHQLAIANRVYFGRHQDGTLESEFSGNLVEVCPTGVFTDKTFSGRYTRKWDIQSAPSLCVHCAVGCNTQPGERYGELRRIMNRYNGEVNGYFLCDRGRFGYAFVNSERRIRQVMSRSPDGPAPARPAEVLAAVGERVRDGRAIGIGSPRASLEANYLLRELVGAERFYAGVSADEHRLHQRILEILREGPAQAASLADAEQADCVLVLGEDITNTNPRLALSVRQALRRKARELAEEVQVPPWQDIAVEQASGAARHPLFVLCPDETPLDDAARRTFQGPPETIARLGYAIAHRVHGAARPVTDLAEEDSSFVAEVVDALANARRPLIVSGTGCRSIAVLEAAADLASALKLGGGDCLLWLAVPECNSLGLALTEAPPIDTAFATLEAGANNTLIVLENDLYRRAPRSAVDAALGKADTVLVLDQLQNETTERADLLLPAATFAESDGTMVSAEGRAQRYFKVLSPGEERGVRESWRWLEELRQAASPEARRHRALEEVTAEMAESLPAFRRAPDASPAPGERRRGVRIPRATPRYSGRTAEHANAHVKELPPPADPDSPLVFSMEGGVEPAKDVAAPWYWTPRWNSNEALNRFQQEIPGPLRAGNPGVRLIERRAHALPRFFADAPAPFRSRPDRWLLTPLHHIFGGDELSAEAPAIAGLAPEPYLALTAKDAKRLGLAPGDHLTLRLDGSEHRLALRIRNALTPGTAGLPVGLPGLAGLALPAWAEILPAGGEGDGDE